MLKTPISGSNLTWLWMHDTGERPVLDEKAAVDTVLVLSEWHKQHIAGLYPFAADKLLVVGNGIDPERFKHALQGGVKALARDPATGNLLGAMGEVIGHERHHQRFIYASSPDRGLAQVLDYWPDIKKALPEAELRIAYGWAIYDAMGGNSDFKRAVMKQAALSEGVKWLGRVNQSDLAREYAEASVMLYPGPHDFLETFCISAIEAQAAGCVPVTRDNGALPETNKHGVILPNDSSREAWIRAAIEATSTSTAKRERMSEWAREQTWARVATRIVGRAMADTRKKFPEEQEQKVEATAD
jgi:glycosyltransferase involved in cell wall biosynthesis